MCGAGEPSRACGETLLWWVVTAGVWLATVSAPTPAELVVLAACTLPCAVAARFARRANGGHWGFRGAWAGWLAAVLAELPKQTVEVWGYTLLRDRRRRSTVGRVQLPAEPQPVADARRAGALLALATTPGTVVLDASSTAPLLLHRTGPQPGRLEGRVRR